MLDTSTDNAPEPVMQRPENWPTVGVSVVIFSLQLTEEERRLSVLLVRRDAPPFAGMWALPGGWVHYGEGLEQAARRHLRTKTGLRPTYLEQLYTFGQPGRDPREHRIAVAYYALVRNDEHELSAAPEREARWYSVDQLPAPLAFDNDAIISYALWRLRNKVSYAAIAFQLLPPTFTLTQLREVYLAILGTKIDPTNFRRKVEASGTIVPTGARVEGGAHRPPQLYRCTLSPDQLFTGPPS
ncbi:MAG: NUDIX hydrolase [Roseiflexaceae bacterium]|nr:NUDIX hydrolase [Roseiflexaceae bacterium]